MKHWYICAIFIFLQHNRFSLVHGITLEQLKNIHSTEDFIERVPMRYRNGSRINLSSLIHQNSSTGAMHISGGEDVVMATFGRCEPSPVAVALSLTNRPLAVNELVWPPCIRVQRCSGCSPAEVLSCEPVETNIVPFSVVLYELPSPDSPEYEFKEFSVVEVEVHKKCGQVCRIKETDCIPDIQRYIEKDCKCQCIDRHRCPISQQIWREETCRCECAYKETCHGFAVFDEITCSCQIARHIGAELTPEQREELIHILGGQTRGNEQALIEAETTPAPSRCMPPIPCPLPNWEYREMPNGDCGCLPNFGRRRRRRRRR